MKPKNIFITGGTGCVGKYLLNQLLNSSEAILHLLVRTPSRLDSFYKNNPRVKAHAGALDRLSEQEEVIRSCDVVVHIATSWCDNDSAMYINRDCTLELFNIAEEGVCKRIIYFSTASILNHDNQLNKEAYDVGPMYIKSKYKAHEAIQKLNYKTEIYTVYPTIVMGGNSKIVYSHISGGIKNYKSYFKYLRFLSLNGAFNFIHTQDIAEMTCHLIYNGDSRRKFVLGQKSVSIKKAIQGVTEASGLKGFFQFPLNTKWILFLAKLLRIKIDPWGKYCISHSEQVYKVTDPSDFNLTNHFPSFIKAVKSIEGFEA